ncbi:DUF1573 domain-containing protein [Lignipirellula cremea]|uniref:DUF1573 domain-containing protein n=1 Tax=Lignipirellula cremea TaxID=2528010 RepID=A0A518DS37_9BACT|nr:DUF1573 domain-containing protein [Lignipirellula cremea]QDU94655.1 hypothetical protein Pla8534_24610 [Lignipirellula cremea]
MKTLLLPLSFFLLGVLIGAAVCWSKISSVPDFQPPPPRDPGKSVVHGVPQVQVVGSERYEFGLMERGDTQEHTFVLTNVGGAPLELTLGKTTCSCTLAELSNASVPPSGKTEVRLEWSPKGNSNAFAQSAEIYTNDPTQPVLRLAVKGKVRQLVAPDTERLSLGDILSTEGKSASFRLFNYTADPLELTSLDWTDPTAGEFLKLTSSPLAAADLAGEEGAKEGVLVEVAAKPGLPLGPIRQTIQIAANPQHSFQIPVTGTVISDLSWLSTGMPFRRETSLLTWGTIDRKQGAEATIYLLAKGPHRNDAELTVDKVEPPGLIHVQIDPPRELENGKSRMFPVKLSVPPGSDAIRLMGLTPEGQAKVVLHSSVPGAESIPLFINLSID